MCSLRERAMGYHTNRLLDVLIISSHMPARSRRQQRFREIKNMHVGRLNGHNFW